MKYQQQQKVSSEEVSSKHYFSMGIMWGTLVNVYRRMKTYQVEIHFITKYNWYNRTK